MDTADTFDDSSDCDNDFDFDSNSYKTKAADDASTKLKIFVGNVPFSCSQEDFERCFVGVPGIIRAEIVRGMRDDSRGIGFVTMDNEISAEALKCREDIKCKGRVLRFYAYHTNFIKKQDSYSYTQTQTYNNYVYVDGIPLGKDRAWLKETFEEYGPFNRCFVFVNNETGERKTSGLLDLVDDRKYDRIIRDKVHRITDTGTPDTITLTTVKYRPKNSSKYKPRKNARKEQLLSAMIIEESKECARERAGKRFHK